VALQAAQLRGGIARDDAWARTPDQPLIAVSTVDQVGSRLLFRGYGLTPSMRPVHAGLLGADVLYLLDEVHLSQPFSETLDAIGQRYRHWAEERLEVPFVTVEMSATPPTRSESQFGLDDRDREHPLLARRLRASKPVQLVSTSRTAFLKEIEKQALAMVSGTGRTVAVVVNRVDSAREIWERLTAAARTGVDVHLLTGRMRPVDRDQLERVLLPRIRAGRTRRHDTSPMIVVSTQAIEAGADFDFDGLITECASLDALRQRFGRLDRLGELNGAARGVVVTRMDTLEDDPVYGNAIGKTHQWLQESARDGVIDFGLDHLAVPAGADVVGLLAPSVHAPVLLPSHLDAWVQTAPPPHADPDVALWLHGPQRGTADVHVIWRADLAPDLLALAARTGERGAEAAEIALSIVDALPPSTGEAMSVPFVAAKRWLEGGSEATFGDVEGAREAVDDDETAGQTPRAVVLWLGDESRVILPSEIRPGSTLIVPSMYGGVEGRNWAPSATSAVPDVAEVAAWRQRRRPVLRLHPAVALGLFGSMEVPVPRDAETEAGLDDEAAVVEWLRDRSASPVVDELREILAVLQGDRRLRVSRFTAGASGSADEFFVVSAGRRGAGISSSNGESVTDRVESSFTGVRVALHAHADGVASVVQTFARRLGLPLAIASDLKLAAAWHDAGKADRRFQRWLWGGSEFKALTQDEPLAKGAASYPSRMARSRARERSGFPAGGRHECTSVALMTAAEGALAPRAQDWTLVRHLVASHHGHARPLVPWVPDPTPVDVRWDHDGVSAQASSVHGLERFDSGVPEAFWYAVRKYGWWGLAWLEAIFRLADHVESAREQGTDGVWHA
jgi:CRISPR-associated endonuclease/helicase Cas3